MIRAIHALEIMEALASTAEVGPVFDAFSRCLNEVKSLARDDAIEATRDRSVDDLEISEHLVVLPGDSWRASLHVIRDDGVCTIVTTKTSQFTGHGPGEAIDMLRDALDRAVKETPI